MPRFTKDSYCVLQGGSWRSYCTDFFHANYHSMFNPVDWNYIRGFRCVSTIDSLTTKKLVRIK